MLWKGQSKLSQGWGTKAFCVLYQALSGYNHSGLSRERMEKKEEVLFSKETKKTSVR